MSRGWFVVCIIGRDYSSSTLRPDLLSSFELPHGDCSFDFAWVWHCYERHLVPRMEFWSALVELSFVFFCWCPPSASSLASPLHAVRVWQLLCHLCAAMCAEAFSPSLFRSPSLASMAAVSPRVGADARPVALESDHVWFFADRELFGFASFLFDTDAETAWAKLWLLGKASGNVWGSSRLWPKQRCRVALCLEAVCSHCIHELGFEERREQALPGGLALRVAGPDAPLVPDAIALWVSRLVFARAIGFTTGEVDICWGDLRGIAEFSGALFEFDGEEFIRLEVVER